MVRIIKSEKLQDESGRGKISRLRQGNLPAVYTVFFAIWLLQLLTAYGQPTNDTNDKLLTFQKFVNGEIPIKEAIVLRTISKTNGVVINQEWWRFGYQDDTWFVQRLRPDEQSSYKFVAAPSLDGAIVGASFTHFWTLSDKNIDIADKTNALGSVPDKFGAFPRNLMFSALSLGIPRRLDGLDIDEIEWDGPKFRTRIGDKYNKSGALLKNAFIEGELRMDENGLPISAEFSDSGKTSVGSVVYQYEITNIGIPHAFISKQPPIIVRCEFLTLIIGKTDLANTGGYIPSIFADMKVSRVVSLWTNSLAYQFKNGKSSPEFETTHPKRIGVLTMIFLGITLGTFLALWYWRTKKRQ